MFFIHWLALVRPHELRKEINLPYIKVWGGYCATVSRKYFTFHLVFFSVQLRKRVQLMNVCSQNQQYVYTFDNPSLFLNFFFFRSNDPNWVIKLRLSCFSADRLLMDIRKWYIAEEFNKLMFLLLIKLIII